MSNYRQIILSVLLIAAVALVFRLAFERYEHTRDLGWTKEARAQAFLALALLSDSEPAKTVSVRHAAELGDLSRYTSLLVEDSALLSADDFYLKLLRWIEDGGQLIIGLNQHSYTRDIFSEDFSFHALEIPEDETPRADENQDSEDEPSENTLSDPVDTADEREQEETLTEKLLRLEREYADIPVDELRDAQAKTPLEDILERERKVENAIHTVQLDEERGYRVHMPTPTLLDHPALHSQTPVQHTFYIERPASTETTPFDTTAFDTTLAQTPLSYRVVPLGDDSTDRRVMQLQLGLGRIWVLSDLQLFNNHNLDLFDHAELWQALVGQSPRLAILYGRPVMPSLWQLMRLWLPECLVSFCVMLLAWLWRSIYREGPVCGEATLPRRSQREHFEAAALFQWRHHARGDLLEALQKDIRASAASGLTLLDTRDEPRLFAALAKASGLSADEVRFAMTLTAPQREEDFTRCVRLLQLLRNAL